MELKINLTKVVKHLLKMVLQAPVIMMILKGVEALGVNNSIAQLAIAVLLLVIYDLAEQLTE